MDTAPGAPADSTLDEQRPKGTPEHELSSFGPDSPKAPEPEEREDEKNTTAKARTAGSHRKICRRHALQTNLPRNRTGFCRRSGFAARPSDRNENTSAQVKTSPGPQSSAAPSKPQSPTLFPERPVSPARRSSSAGNRAD